MQTLRIVLVSASLAAFAMGCGSEPPPEPQVPQNQQGSTANVVQNPKAAGPQQDTATPTSGSVQIDDRIMKACGNVPKAQFSFDSANIASEAAATLDALAACFVTGALKGHGMKLVGHADPRGEEGYNLALGQRRAGSVGEYLGKKGLESSRVQTSSKGEFEATGVDEHGWARDRRVEVLLAD